MITKRRILLHLDFLYLKFLMKFDKTVFNQINNPKEIPIIIINFNQLFFLKKLVDFLLKREFKNIVIIDNASTYPPLLRYYEQNKNVIKVEKLSINEGHDVFFKNKDLQKKYARGFYFLTDADIVPNENLPKDFPSAMLSLLLKYYKKINKIGFAIDTESIPDYYPLKQKVQAWEKRFWETELEKDLFFANIDTTFALYKPKYPKTLFNLFNFMTAIRMAGPYTCLHGGWYIDPNNMTEENLFYIETANKSSSWKINKEGQHTSQEYDSFI